MRPRQAFPAGTVEQMQRLLKQVGTVADQRRIQAVLMRASDNLPPQRIAALTGLSVASVRIIHSRFLREGVAFLTDRPGRGGRRRTLLQPEQVERLLAKHTAAASAGQIVEAGTFKREYEALVGHKVAASSVYRLLAKAGWRKIVPRPSHPKQNPAAQADFKKTSRKR